MHNHIVFFPELRDEILLNVLFFFRHKIKSYPVLYIIKCKLLIFAVFILCDIFVLVRFIVIFYIC